MKEEAFYKQKNVPKSQKSDDGEDKKTFWIVKSLVCCVEPDLKTMMTVLKTPTLFCKQTKVTPQMSTSTQNVT